MAYHELHEEFVFEGPTSVSVPKDKVAALEAVARKYCLLNPTAEQKMEMATEISQLVNDPDVNVRASLSHSVMSSPNLEKWVALQLAMDKKEVASPILENSTVLGPKELLSLLKSGSEDIHLSIAKRSPLQETIAAYIAEHSSRPIVIACLANQAAELNDRIYEKILTRFAKDAEVIDTLLKRGHFDEDSKAVICKLLPLSYHELVFGDEEIPYLVKYRRRRTLSEATLVTRMTLAKDETKKVQILEQITNDGRLSETLMLRLFLVGEEEIFAKALAKKCDVPMSRIRVCLKDRALNVFQQILKLAHISPYLHSAFKITFQSSPNQSLGEKPDPSLALSRICSLYKFGSDLDLDQTLKSFLPIADPTD
ncbi:DUF2336 domain-containing protein [Sneathiella limimaris]|uniref:DUF2336 domain-containing protein n=1 Tax=Sneathiella limimaris TaxID=1964213 RepID=UPI00146BEAAF|nr:DUF2336 domain-containing protein [Sneathiella limimaris]